MWGAIVNVRELIAKLKEYPGDMPVLLSKDSEGNKFYQEWELEVMTYSLEHDDIVWDEDGFQTGEDCLVLCP